MSYNNVNSVNECDVEKATLPRLLRGKIMGAQLWGARQGLAVAWWDEVPFSIIYV